MTDPSLETAVRRQIYESVLATGKPPSAAAISRDLEVAEDETRGALLRLAEGHVLVLQPDSGEILMAPPFSAVPTSFEVETARFRTWGNCIWDALGIPVMARDNARIRTSCGCCGSALTLDVTGGSVEIAGGDSGAWLHFAVPARHWWRDIVFT